MPVSVKKTNTKKHITFPPVVKLLVRGYLIMGFILGLEKFGFFNNTSVIIFCITVISISMVFGVGYMLAMKSGPVRAGSFDVPSTALFFVKGSMILYFVTLIGEFGILPQAIVSTVILLVASVLILIGVLSYVYEVVNRTRPVPKRKCRDRPTAR